MWTLCRRLRIVKCHATRVAKLTRDLSTTRDMRPGRIPCGGRRGWFRLVERCDSRCCDDEGEHHQRSESRRFEALRETEARTSNNTGEPPGGTVHGQALGCTDTRRRLHGTTGSTDQAAPPAGRETAVTSTISMLMFPPVATTATVGNISNLCSKRYMKLHAVSNTFSIPVAFHKKSTPRH